MAEDGPRRGGGRQDRDHNEWKRKGGVRDARSMYGRTQSIMQQSAVRKNNQTKKNGVYTYRGIGRGLLGEVDEERLDEVVHQGGESRARVRSGGGPPFAHGAVFRASAVTVSGLNSQNEGGGTYICGM